MLSYPRKCCSPSSHLAIECDEVPICSIFAYCRRASSNGVDIRIEPVASVPMHSVHCTLRHEYRLGLTIPDSWRAQRQAQYIWLLRPLWALSAHLNLAVEPDGAAQKMCNQCSNSSVWARQFSTALEHKKSDSTRRKWDSTLEWQESQPPLCV